MIVENNFWHTPPWQGGSTKHRMGLRPIAMADWLQHDEALLANKRLQLHNRYGEVVGQTADFEPPDDGAWDWPLVADAPANYPHWIGNVASGCAEDVCILDLADQQRLVAGCLAAPSYWSLAQKLGKPLWQVHGPVHGLNAKLGDNIQRFMSNAPVGQPFHRQNWFAHADREYFHTGNEPAGRLPPRCDQWLLRSEQQVLFKPCARYMVFTIRVVFADLSELGDYPLACTDLVRALSSFDNHEVAHFGGDEKYQRLLAYVVATDSKVNGD